MLEFLGVLYGLHLVLMIYGVAYFTVKGFLKGGAVSILITLLKFGLYYVTILFGFETFPHLPILAGFSGGIYLSLILFWLWSRYPSLG